MSESRTSKSLKNAWVALFFYAINVVIGFWKRQVFFDYLGSEVLGLDTTASTLFSFLNLAELGIGSSVGYFLYRPMFLGDTLTMNKIVALQGWIYRRIAMVVMAGSAILMCFFPIIFSKIQLPLWYAYATFTVMLVGAMLGYFMNYRQCILAADQKGYKVTKVTSTANVVFQVLLIFLLPVVSCPFILYISTTLAGSVIGCVWLNYVLHRDYPWLARVEESGRHLLQEYPEIIKKTKQIFFHKITTFIVNQVSPLVMYAFTSLTAVAYYGNYLATIDRAKDVLKTAFASTGNAIGNLVASNDEKRIKSVFWELIDSRLCISFGCILVLGLICEPFISVWLSPKYLLGHDVLILVCVLSWLSINRSTVDSYIGGYGLFQDIWAPAVEAVINLGLAFCLGYFFDIAGVLMGGLVSNLIIVNGWKPYFLYTRGFKQNPWKGYFLPMAWRWGLLAVNGLMFIYIGDLVRPAHLSSYLEIALYALLLSLLILPVIYIEFYSLTSGTRRFHKRIWGIVKEKIHK